jgi:hypothetical protein
MVMPSSFSMVVIATVLTAGTVETVDIVPPPQTSSPPSSLTPLSTSAENRQGHECTFFYVTSASGRVNKF